MKLLEKVIYSGVLFLFLYLVISLGLRFFEITTVYMSHLIGGIVASVAGIGLFMFLLIVKKEVN